MTPAEMLAKLDAMFEAGEFYGLSLWPTKHGIQSNLMLKDKNSSFRVRFGKKPSQGLEAVLSIDMLDADGKMPDMIAPPAVDEPPLPAEEPGIFD